MDSDAEPRLLAAKRCAEGVSCLDAFGSRLVTGGGGALRLWSWTGGAGWQQSERVAAHRWGVTATRWAPGGAEIASCGVDGAARIWSRSLGARRVLAAGGATAARALCWAGGGRLVVGHDDGTARVWCARRGLALAVLRGHEGALVGLCCPARGALLLAACTDGVLKVYDLHAICESGGAGGAGGVTALCWVDGAHDLGALCAADSECGTLAATGGHDAFVRLWRIEGSGRSRHVVEGARLAGHGGGVTALRWARSVLAVAAMDRTARLWAIPPNSSTTAVCLAVIHAHQRYLTCIALSYDLRYLVTGSSDKSFRMWSLRGLTLEDELEPTCDGSEHFGLGDLEGISPLDDDDSASDVTLEEGAEAEAEAGAGNVRLWSAREHAGAVNSVAVQGDLLASASSDGMVKIFRWERNLDGGGSLVQLASISAHECGALCAAWCGPALLSAGNDDRAVLWDAESGCALRTLSFPGGAEGGVGGAAGAGVGGGGARGAAVSSWRPALLLLAADDGTAPLWTLTNDDPEPIHVYGPEAEGTEWGALWCAAWSGARGRCAALGGATGALRLLAPPPTPRLLATVQDAHDLGIMSCQFASSAEAAGCDDAQHVLATAGGDSLVKLWTVHMDEDDEYSTASVQLLRTLEAHCGAAAGVWWGGGSGGAGGAGGGDGAVGLLCSAGEDGWARVWRARTGACLAAVPAATAAHISEPDAGGALCVALMADTDGAELDTVLLVLGTLRGGLALWRVRASGPGAAAELAGDPRWWETTQVAQWLKDYVTRVPDSPLERDEEAALLGAASAAQLVGSHLLDEPLPDLLRMLGFDGDDVSVEETSDSEDDAADLRRRLLRELRWLRRSLPHPTIEEGAPHWLRCALSHRLLAAPVRACDGLTYERSVAHCLLDHDGGVSPVSGRSLRGSRLLPNYRLARTLRVYCRKAERARVSHAPQTPDDDDVVTAQLVDLAEE